jgi:glucose/arabinose dehydrogenase
MYLNLTTRSPWGFRWRGFVSTRLMPLVSLTLLLLALPSQAAVSDTAICFDNPNGFNNPTVYLWAADPANAINDGNWPGQPMSAEGNHYCYDPGVAVNSIQVIFNDNGANQSGDLTLNNDNSCYQNGNWTTLATCGLTNTTTTTVTPTTICYDNSAAYANPTLYLWDAVPQAAMNDFAWPGQAMIATDNYFCLDPGVTLTSVSAIFSNNGNGQSADLTMTSPNGCYKNNSWGTLQSCGFTVSGAQNVPPVANAGADITLNITSSTGQTANFDASGSSDSDGSIVSYSWDNGLSGVAPTLTYNTPGIFNVTLTVTDNEGDSTNDSVTVTVEAAPVYNYPAGNAIYYINNTAWGQPTAYIWAVLPADSMADGAWPGVAMNDFGGLNTWTVDIAETATSGNVIFSNSGNQQTGDQTFLPDTPCYNNGNWMTLAQCGIPSQTISTADAGADRTVNVNSVLALSAAASTGISDNATWDTVTWESNAWTGTLSGQSVVTPTLSQTGTFTVTLTLAPGNTDSFELTVVDATQGLAQRPLLATPLNFPLSGSVSNGNYTYELAFPAINSLFPAPMIVTSDGLNDLIYVVDKSGTLSVFPNDPAISTADVVTLLDWSATVRSYHEQGMLSMAFDPDFASNGHAYIYYIEGNNDNESDNGVFGDGVLERITLNNPLSPQSVAARVEILRVPQVGPDHKGSMMQFHPATGEFYMSFGDGGYGDTAIVPTQPDTRTNNSSQETDNLLGSFIRVNMRDTANAQGLYYDIPADNPFVADSAVRDEIWSYGHRNPWRWAFDTVAPYTLWETEVGQSGYEEVNIITAGNNYGWPICEGLTHRGSDGGDPNNDRSCTGDLIGPIGGYEHDEGQSIIGGFVYRGTSLPALTGRFIYGDYVIKKIWTAGGVGDTQVLASDAFPSNIAAFGTDLSGEEVFVSAYGGEFGWTSEIYRMVDSDVQAAVIPAKLSDTGIFADLPTRMAANGVIEYSVNADGWFDGLQARHFIAVPNDENINFADTDSWDLPVGTVLVKHLELPTSATTTVAYETSVLFRQNSGNWAAANYRWNAAGTDADLVTTPSEETVSQYYNGSMTEVTHNIRSGADCTSCHIGTGSKDPLATETRQLNGDFNYQGFNDNQLDVLNNIGLFANDIGSAINQEAYSNPADTTADLDLRARAYLDANCAHCHSGSFMDMDYDTPVGEMDIMNVIRGSNYRMLPFDHTASLLHTYQTDDANRMPKGSHLTNPLADQLIADWIDALDASQTGMLVKLAATQDLVSGSALTLSAFASFDNGFEAIPSGNVSWSSSNSNVIAVNGNSPILSLIAQNAGVTTISADSGGYSGSVEVTVVGAPTQPSNFTALATLSTAITLTWNDDATDELGYVVSRAINASGPFSIIATLPANSDSLADSGLTADTQYYYQLVATGSNADATAVSTNTTTPNGGLIDSLAIISSAINNPSVTLIAGETLPLVAVATLGDEEIGEEEVGVGTAANWSSSDPTIVAISASGVLTGGNVAGTVSITADYQGISSSIDVDNVGPAQYLYFNKPLQWTTVTSHIWTNEAGTLTIRSGAWPGTVQTQSASAYGGQWLRLTMPIDWLNSNADINIIFSDSGNGQTADLNINLSNPAWYDGQWLATEPMGNGITAGTQIQVGNGSVTLAGSDNLSGKLFAPGTVVDINADIPGTGLAFSHWEGSGIAYLLNVTNPNTQMVVGDGLSQVLLAVFDSVIDSGAVGREYYNNQGCSGCHGSEGNGSTSLLGVPNSYTLAQLIGYIEDNMPLGNAAACIGECASSIADMIMAGTYLPPENVCRADSLDDLVPQDRNYRLLSALEYNNSVRDLLGLTGDVDVTSGNIPADIPVNGFKTNANSIFTNDYAKGYIVAAETAAGLVNNIFSLTANCSDISCFIAEFGKRAFRQPLTTAQTDTLTAVYNAQGELGLMTAILSSPALLYRSEIGVAEGNGYYRLTDYEVASMLSYTYWATTPDAALLAKADAGELNTPAQISATVNSMLLDAKAQTAFDRFIVGWLDLDKSIKTTSLSDSLKADMKQETLEFVRSIVFAGGSYNDLLTADYSYMTSQLASHYGLQWPGGSGFQQVAYSSDATGANAERSGLLGHASILAIQSASEKTHPVKRGLFVRRNLMCQDFPPPPIGAILSPQEDPTLTVRERFETAHLQDGCEACHQYIDGIGFGLENYNAVGQFVSVETTDDGQVKPINALGYIGSLLSAETFLSESDPVVDYQGMDELSTLIADSAHGKACYARQWYRYTRGQREMATDNCTLQVFGQAFKDGGNTSNTASMLDLMVQFTQTPNYSLRK